MKRYYEWEIWSNGPFIILMSLLMIAGGVWLLGRLYGNW